MPRLPINLYGGTGTGKTTLLQAMLAEVNPDQRIVIVEDATELRPAHPHVVGLEARLPNIEGAGAVTTHDLVRQALRMRPDRLIVGEVRGAEVVAWLSAMNTGHEGGAGTIHANTMTDVPSRIEALALSAGLPRAAAHAQLASALKVVLHVERRAGARRLRSIGVFVKEGPWVSVRPAVMFDGAAATRGPGYSTLTEVLAWTSSS